LAPVFRERLRGALRIPALEALFPVPWTVAARRMIPSASPQRTATALWGPVLGWCALELLAESIDAENPERASLDLFDRLRLREPFAQAFTALGYEGEEAWRAAARIKVVLLTGAGVGKQSAEAVDDAAAATKIEAAEPVSAASAPQESGKSDEVSALGDERVAIAPTLWLDPDVRWLTGTHESEGHAYLVREPYEELLWWLLMPSLLRLGSETAPSRAAIAEMSKTVEEALATAEAAGFRIDALLGPVSVPASVLVEEPAPAVESLSTEPEPLQIEGEEPHLASIEAVEAEVEKP